MTSYLESLSLLMVYSAITIYAAAFVGLHGILVGDI